ncbi:hypothetical protein GQ44DRAFT_691723 [Phaeosphaeriaceae sp. PMI808]|nr:hypothetical protein GQ44DRAFT_691723 [Phaeosphaeriaceae sp. PMI808]
MPTATGTQHHCPGRDRWIGTVPPGNCKKSKAGRMLYCKVHQTPCRNGCAVFHLLTDRMCSSCLRMEERHASQRRQHAESQKREQDRHKDDCFWNPSQERKK